MRVFLNSEMETRAVRSGGGFGGNVIKPDRSSTVKINGSMGQWTMVEPLIALH